MQWRCRMGCDWVALGRKSFMVCLVSSITWSYRFGMRRSSVCRLCFFFSSRRRHTRFDCDWSSDVCSSDLESDASSPGFFGGDRVDIDLPRPQEQMLEAVAAAHKPLIVVLTSGSALAVNWEIGRASCRERV